MCGCGLLSVRRERDAVVVSYNLPSKQQKQKAHFLPLGGVCCPKRQYVLLPPGPPLPSAGSPIHVPTDTTPLSPAPMDPGSVPSTVTADFSPFAETTRSSSSTITVITTDGTDVTGRTLYGTITIVASVPATDGGEVPDPTLYESGAATTEDPTEELNILGKKSLALHLLVWRTQKERDRSSVLQVISVRLWIETFCLPDSVFVILSLCYKWIRKETLF